MASNVGFRNLVDRLLTEEGVFYTLAGIMIFFSAWLVINYNADPKVFYGYSILLLITMVYRFIQKSDFAESFPLFNEDNIYADIAFGIGAGLLWVFTVLQTPLGAMQLPPLPESLFAQTGVGLLIVVVLAPIAEEYAFRGTLLPTLNEILGNPYFGLGIQAVVFAAFHYLVYGSREAALISAVLFALYVGVLTTIRKSTVSSMITHAIINLGIALPAFALFV